jgi:small subunit ribosomal protein S1
MTNPDAPHDTTPAAEPTPPQTPAAAEPARVAEEQSAAPPAPTPATAAATAEGGESGGDEHGEAGEAGEGESTGEGGGEGAAATGAAGPTGEKKRRRRRRKKKPGAHAGEAAVEGAPGEPKPEGAGDEAAATAEGAPAGEARHEGRPKKQDKKEKKHGPPRERPPVNGGDIVFGKILEITDEAILIDIPGKAKAIFDRAEMLLPDDEDERGKPVRERRPVQAEEPAAEGSVAEGTVAEAPAEGEVAVAAEVEAAEEAEATESPAAVPEVEAPAAEAAVEAAPVEAAAEAPAAEVAGQAAPAAEPTPEAPKEPKVPRVILEVGADFIGVVHNDGARGGLVVLTHHPRRADKARVLVEKAFNDKTTVMGLVTGVIKGGIEVDVDGLRAFAPGSHVELRLGSDLSHLVAKRLPFFVTQYAKRGRDLVLSRRAMLEEEAKKTRAEVLSKLKVGEEIEGTVRSVVPFGAFVDVGGVEGLVPLQEMSHNRADGPNDVFKVGEPTKVKVTKIDERGKIWLSHKATIPDPWSEVASKYAQGTRHTGTVARLQPFGVFVELEPGIDGLIHLADLSLTRIESPSEVVKVGDPIEVVVSHVEPGTHRIALHPALKGDAANEAPQKIQPHKPVKAKVVTIETGGLVVRILGVTGRNARGYVTAAGTGTQRGTELRKVFKPGQEIEGKVLEIDPRRGEIKLSIKALGEDNERNAYQQYRQQLKAEAKFTFGDLLNKTTPKR